MNILKWKDREKYLLTQEARHKHFQYVVFWGTTTEMDYARIFVGDKQIGETCSANRNFGKHQCIEFCERHAWKNCSPVEKAKHLLTKYFK